MEAFIEPVQLKDETSELILLDQTLLPNKVEYLHLTTQESIWEAIYKLQVRGAPAIGVAAAYGVYLGAKASTATTFEAFKEDFMTSKNYLASSRPTAVNLFWALERMQSRLEKEADKTVSEVKEALLEEANQILLDDKEVCQNIGEFGSELLKDGMTILTHCNAGAIATTGFGTALAPVYVAKNKGLDISVYADETRPLLQGARLTAWELVESGIDTTLICDNMASIVMKEGKIDAIFVGCDRVALNGDAANKIGTSGVAILAKHYGVPFYVCAPLSTIDVKCATGDDIEIEERPGSEITDMWYETPMAPTGVKTYNPAFDVTSHELITGIITEKGILKGNYKEAISELFDLN
ncbi:MAG: S-methyl-5-thioribose-1-phosphate isomerase [Vagococcus sp.]|uniref:S-methyl-5-thioribose-1-phosphate isomerase n=1 Tax=Vagococcus TaxID=2737 RepID=UPI002FCC5EF3